MMAPRVDQHEKADAHLMAYVFRELEAKHPAAPRLGLDNASFDHSPARQLHRKIFCVTATDFQDRRNRQS
jgi:hypothetical protein